ncbi:MAG: hypothetical protein AB1333_00975 [Patescibacteria group bacterium]
MEFLKKIFVIGLIGTFTFSPVFFAHAQSTSTPPSVFDGKGDKAEDQGFELCDKAARLSVRLGAMTALDHVQTDILNGGLSFVSEQFSGTVGINIDFVNLKQQGMQYAYNFISNTLNDIFGNKLKDEVNKKIDDIKDSLIGKATGAVEDAISLGVSPIPVAEKGDLLGQTKQLVAEQKRQEVIAQTRSKCAELLKNTNEQIKRALLYQFSSQITDWITSGEAPQFVKDPTQFIKDTAQLAVDRTISRIAPRLCTPFQLSIVAEIPTTNRQANPFYEELTCTLDQVTENVEAFYNDFRSGGWISYQEMWKPQNNYYGASMLVNQKIQEQQATAIQLTQEDLQRGSGFPSQTQCTEWRLYVPADCKLNSLQHTYQDILQVQGKCFASTEEIRGPTDDGKAPSIQAGAPEGSKWQCQKTEITNPGTVTAGLSQKAQQVELDQLAAANDIENFLDNITDAIVNKLVKSGVGGLQKILKGLPGL